MKRPSRLTDHSLLCTVGILLLLGSASPAAQPVTAPDNGTGTIDWPVAGTPFINETRIRRTLHALDPPSQQTRLELQSLKNISITSRTPGGTLGGSRSTGTATALVSFDNGTTFNPEFEILVTFVGDTAIANPPGGDEQDLPTALIRIEGQLPPGDPDFDLLRVTAGSDFGLPSPGHTTLTRLGPPGSDFAVDSFFDLTYRIEWQGAPGGALAGLGGIDDHTDRLEQPLRALDGARFEANGQATALLTPDGLTISNIGSSGLDGVTFVSPPPNGGSKRGHEYYRATIAPDPSGSLLSQPGEELTFSVGSDADQNDVVFRYTGRCSVVGGSLEFDLVEATELAVAAYLNDQLVATTTVPAGDIAFSMNVSDFDLSEIELGRADYFPCFPVDPDAVVFRPTLRTPKPLVLGPQTASVAAIADSVVITAQRPESGRPPTIFEFRGSNLLPNRTITFTGLEFGSFGLPHRGLGEAIITTTPDDGLRVANIGSSGLDGVSTDLGPSNGEPFRDYLAWLTPLDVLGQDGSLRAEARDSFGNPLCHLEFAAPGLLTADFSPLGASTIRIDIYSNGSLVGSHTLGSASGQIATVANAQLTGCRISPGLPPLQRAAFCMTFDVQTDITPSGGVPLAGNEVRLIALDAQPGALDDWRFAVLAPNHLRDLTAEAIVVHPDSCHPAILPDNGTGTIDYPPALPLLGLRTLTFDGGTGGTLTFPSPEITGLVPLGPGPLGGDLYQGDLFLHPTGQGTLAGFERQLIIPVQLELQQLATPTHGDAIQGFQTEMLSLQAELVGDPDFDLLRVRAGSAFGLPSPGQTTLSRLGLPGTDFRVSATFDVNFTIEIQGNPASALAGVTGINGHRDNWGFIQRGLVFDGLLHFALGQANLSADPAGNLVVSNIGSSGLDGVSIDLPGAEGLDLELEPRTLNPGESLTASATGELPGIATEVPLGSLTLDSAPTGTYSANFTFSALASSGVTDTTLTALNNGVVVAQTTSGLSGTIQIDPAPSQPVPPVSRLLYRPGLGSSSGFAGRFAIASLITLPAQAPVIADEFRVLAQIVVPRARVSRFDLKVELGAPLQIKTTSPTYFGRKFHLVDRSTPVAAYNPPNELGERRLILRRGVIVNRSTHDGTPTVSPPFGFRLQESDQSFFARVSERLRHKNRGITIFDYERLVLEDFSDLDPCRCINSSLAVEARGTAGGAPDTSLGTLDFQQDTAGNVQLLPDFTSLGASDTRVKLFASSNASDRLAPLLDVVLPSGSNASWISGPPLGDAPPFKTAWAFPNPGPEDPFYALELLQDTAITFPTGPAVTGRYLEISPVNPTVPAQTIDSLTLTPLDSPEYLLTGVFDGPVRTRGLEHTSLGSAHTSLDASGNLVVSNIGSSGLDGVSIDLGEADGTKLFAPFNATGGNGTTIRTEICDGEDDDCDGFVDEDFRPSTYLRNTFTDADASSAGRLVIRCESDTDPPLPLRILTWDESGTLTHNGILPQGDLGELVPDFGPTIPFQAWEVLPPAIGPTGSDGFGFGYQFLTGVNYTPPGGLTVPCQRLEIRVEEYVVQYRESDWNFVLRTIGVPSFTLLDEALDVFSHSEVRALGEPKLSMADGSLSVSNIGSSGLDGVSLDLHPPQDETLLQLLEIPYDLAAPVPAPEVRNLTLTQLATNGTSCGNAEICFVEVAGATESGAEVRVDFRPLGTTTARVQLLSGGVVVHQFLEGDPDEPIIVGRVYQSGPLPPALIACGGYRTQPAPGASIPPGYIFQYGGPIGFTPPGQPPGTGFVCDELRVFAEGSGLPVVSEIATISLTATAQPLTITGRAGNSFEDFLLAHFTPAEIALLAAANYQLDLDGDGGDEIDEFVVNSNPTLHDYNFKRPRVAVVDDGGGDRYLQYTFQKGPRQAVDITLFRTEDLQSFSTNPTDWTLFQVLFLPGGNTEFTYRRSSPIGAGGRRHEFAGQIRTIR